MLLLIDEIDRADEEFEAFLLEVLSDFQITVPELGTITAKQRPYVILTSNRTRELHDALKRRCLYHWIGHPSVEREIEIVELRVPGVPERLAGEAARFAAELRALDLQKPPGVAETIDWARALTALGQQELDVENVQATLGSLLKYHEDLLVDPRRGARRARRARAGAAEAVAGRRGRPARRRVRPRAARGRTRGRARARSATHCAGSTRSSSAARRTSTGRFARRSSRGARTSRRSTARSTPGSCAPRRSRRRARLDRPRPPGAAAQGRQRPAQGPSSTAARSRSAAGATTSSCASKDFAAMTPEEFARARAADPARSPSTGPRRRSRRLRRDRAARVLDVRGLVRASLATGGDPVDARLPQPRATHRASWCCSSTSRARWSRTPARLLLYLHAARGSGRGVETFAFGTRLSRLTPRARRARSRSRARRGVEARRRLVGRHAHRRVAEGVQRRVGPPGADARRGRRDPLGRLRARRPGSSSQREMARLARQAFAVVWVNPLKGASATTSRSPAACARRFRTSTGSSRATTSPASRRSVQSSAASNGGMQREGDRRRGRALAGARRAGRDRDRRRDAPLGAAAGRREVRDLGARRDVRLGLRRLRRERRRSSRRAR